MKQMSGLFLFEHFTLYVSFPLTLEFIEMHFLWPP